MARMMRRGSGGPQRINRLAARCPWKATRSLSSVEPQTERIISALVVNRPGTLAQLADVFGFAGQNISGLCVRSTVVPELSRVTITCRLRQADVAPLKKRLRALVSVTFFHVTTMQSCVDNNELLLRSHALLQIATPAAALQPAVQRLMDAYGAERVYADDELTVIPDDGLSLESTEELRQREAEDAAARDSSQFLHIIDEPARIDAFIAAIRGLGVTLLELQRCGSPLFLDTSQSTLDPEMKTGFSRRIDEEVERIMMEPEDEHPPGRRRAAQLHHIPGLEHEDEMDEMLNARFAASRAPRTTLQLYTDASGSFTPERLKLHARIAHQLYSAAPQSVATPKFVLLVGIPGAGKSTILSQLDLTGQLTLADFVNFDVDDIIALLPEYYHAMLNVGLGNAEPAADDNDDARLSHRHRHQQQQHHQQHRRRRRLPAPQRRYQMCRDEARFILEKNLLHAIMCRRNIILHGSGKSYSRYASLIDQVQSAGFDVHVMCLDVPLELAYERVERRSSGYGRDVPKLLIDFTASLLPRHFRRLAARVPNAHLFASDTMPPRLVWSKQQARVVHDSPDDPVQRKYTL
ncbi:hypothetical protein P43SY_003667 [Pythium insidiosum]|uniref:ACT domain-containing protein n=1 Tax=Pythium insidiosum TaxID=114742 RepID=A0AAD5M2S6_PYTIN|nr:hypothetical protein P43SY_003667 [Pythium insidiosum]